jgi:hypothetical protein
VSLPPLPEIFGNYALGDFNEVVSPPAIDWLPQTPGWYVVAAALAVLLLRRLWRALLHWHRNRYRGEALRRLAALAQTAGSPAAINEVLKLCAMAARSREQVASLSGPAWPDFLNGLCDSPPFDPDTREWLAERVYREDQPDPATAEALLVAAMRWVREHRNRFDA